MAFQKGVSGNPGGRAKARVKLSDLRRQIDAPAIIATLHGQALAGDTAAARLLLERALPPLRPVDTAVSLAMGDDLAANGKAVVEGIGKGTLTPNQGQAIMGALANLAKLIETTELEQRIAVLEGKQ